MYKHGYAKKGNMIDNSIEYLKEMLGKFNRDRLCWAGYHSLYVDCYGKIFPCFYYMEKDSAFGHISSNSIQKV